MLGHGDGEPVFDADQVVMAVFAEIDLYTVDGSGGPVAGGALVRRGGRSDHTYN